MSTPISHHPLVQLGSRRRTWFIMAGLAVAAVILALALTLPWSNSPHATAKAVPASAGASQAIPKPSVNPQTQDTIARHPGVGAAALKAQHSAPKIAARRPYVLQGPHDLGITTQPKAVHMEGFDPEAGR